MDLANEQLPDNEAHVHPYDEMAIDPQIMEQLQAELYQQGPHTYGQGGMPTFADTPNLQTHHDPGDFKTEHEFIHDPSPGMIAQDHVMEDGVTGTGLSNMQPMQHELPMDYLNPSSNRQ